MAINVIGEVQEHHKTYLVTDSDGKVKGAYHDVTPAVDHVIASSARGTGTLVYDPNAFQDRVRVQPFKIKEAYGDEIFDVDCTQLIEDRLVEVGILRWVTP